MILRLISRSSLHFRLSVLNPSPQKLYPLVRTTRAKQPRRMASDSSYMDFLNKANSDSNTATAQRSSAKAPSMPQVSSLSTSPIPKALQDYTEGPDAVYLTSDTDSPFETIAIEYPEKRMPDAIIFSALLSSVDPEKLQVETMAKFDPKNQYSAMIGSLAEHTEGGEKDLRAYRVEMSGSRAAYYILGKEKGKARLIGFSALSVES